MKDIHLFFKWSVYIMSSIGLAPLYPGTNGICKKILSISYSILVYLILFYIVGRLYYEKYLCFCNAELKFNALIQIADSILVFCCYALVAIFHWIWFHKMETFFGHWERINYLINRLTKSDIQVDKKQNLLEFVVELGAMLMVFTIGFALFDTDVDHIPQYGLLIFFYLELKFWQQYYHMVISICKHLRHNLQFSLTNTEEILACWSELCEKVDLSTKWFSILFIFTIPILTIFVVLHAYTVLIYLAFNNSNNNSNGNKNTFEHEYDEYFAPLVILLFSSSFIYIIGMTSDRLEKKLSLSITKNSVMENVNTQNICILIKYRKLHQVVRTSTPRIRIYSIIHVNKKLLVNLFSIVVSYLFILIQFRISTTTSEEIMIANSTNNVTYN